MTLAFLENVCVRLKFWHLRSNISLSSNFITTYCCLIHNHGRKQQYLQCIFVIHKYSSNKNKVDN